MRTTRSIVKRSTLVLAGAACALVLAAPARAQGGDSLASSPTAASGVSAALEQCQTSVVQSERSATFSGEMTTIAGAAKMAMRIDVEERAPEALEYHTVTAPGLGVWRLSDPKVKVYKYLKQVTNLSSPASYRALVRFRWLDAKGRVIRRTERLTTRCLQPAAPSEATPPSSSESGSTPPSTGTPSTSAQSATPSA
jgi:hypothetical protein